jgi:AcrR family transcriptional regulator
MARAKLSDEELADRALALFRNYGYEGTSLNRIAESTGMEKASLYYRFPRGKEAIVVAVAERVGAWFHENVFQPLADDGPPRERVELVARRLREFYGDGRRPCILDTLSLPGGPEPLQLALRAALGQWLAAFQTVAEGSGKTPSEAKSRAEQALVNVEGSLVLSRVLADGSLFLRALDELGNLLCG